MWKIRYRVPLAPNSRLTKQVKETLKHCDKRTQAENVLALRRAQVFDGTYRPRVTGAPLTVADFVPKFLEVKSELASVAKYKSQFERHLLKRFGRKQLRLVSVADCEDYRRERLAEGAKPATVRNELRCLQSLFVEARRRELMDKDPVAGVAFGKIDNARRRLLSDDERDRLLAHLSSREDFLRPLFMLLYFTGMRLGDAVALEWTAIKMDKNTIAYQQGKTGRWVYPPLHPALRLELVRWDAKCASDTYIFPSPRYGDRPMSIKHAGETWDEMLVAAKVENLWRHDMRRYMVTMLRAAGVGDGVIQSITGHETVSMIERYDSPQIEQARVAVQKMPGLTLVSDDGKPTVNDNNERDKNVVN